MELLKIGGSVANELQSIVQELKGLDRDILIVPGGWIFADLVRDVDEKYGLDESVSHWMAIACMDVYGYYISNFGVEVLFAEDLESLSNVGGVRVILPHCLLKHSKEFAELPASWDVTSDSISVWIASKLGLDRVIKITDVGGVLINGNLVESLTASELLKLNIETCIDKFTPKLLKEYKVDMFVCNAKEVKDYILKGKAKGTLVKGE
ncbi:uridylate kinase [Archaeoglobales archaeon]|nr:MAG: uridylate kinase [Archaeoglobales archaeon]